MGTNLYYMSDTYRLVEGHIGMNATVMEWVQKVILQIKLRNDGIRKAEI